MCIFFVVYTVKMEHFLLKCALMEMKYFWTEKPGVVEKAFVLFCYLYMTNTAAHRVKKKKDTFKDKGKTVGKNNKQMKGA